METVPVPPAAGIRALAEVSVRLHRTSGDGAVEVVADEPHDANAIAPTTATRGETNGVGKFRQRAKQLC
jgi:hypothetical protein